MNLCIYHKRNDEDSNKSLVAHCSTMSHEFEELALDGQNYPTWVVDVKIDLALRGMYEAILPPAERIVELAGQYKYNVLYIIRHHIPPDLKSEYVMEMEPNNLWAAL
jgi:hypothetical protein